MAKVRMPSTNDVAVFEEGINTEYDTQTITAETAAMVLTEVSSSALSKFFMIAPDRLCKYREGGCRDCFLFSGLEVLVLHVEPSVTDGGEQTPLTPKTTRVVVPAELSTLIVRDEKGAGSDPTPAGSGCRGASLPGALPPATSSQPCGLVASGTRGGRVPRPSGPPGGRGWARVGG
jgi:hypothetical protein